jgi:hypothetical protein
MPVLLVAGVVHHLDALTCLGAIRRVRWGSVASAAARTPADIVLVGPPATGGDPLALLHDLRSRSGSHFLPLVHIVLRPPCPGCAADACLPADALADTLSDVTRILLELGRSRHPAAGGGSMPPVRERPPHQQALARPSGGTAREFDGLLGVIEGQCLLARGLLPPSHPAGAALERALTACERAAVVARRILLVRRPPETHNS